jgi:hypothetical protein
MQVKKYKKATSLTDHQTLKIFKAKNERWILAAVASDQLNILI